MTEVVVPLLPETPSLIDDSDTTFLAVPPGSDIQYAATLGTAGIDPATVTRVTVRLRLHQGANEWGEGMSVHVLPSPYTFNNPRTLFNAPNVPPDMITTVELDLFTSFGTADPIVTESAHLAEFLAADTYVMAFVNSTSSPPVTVYEAAVLIYATTTDTVPSRRRTHPRDDNGRNYPRPRAIQSSNRIAGGYL